jgi:hypothetical protein
VPVGHRPPEKKNDRRPADVGPRSLRSRRAAAVRGRLAAGGRRTCRLTPTRDIWSACLPGKSLAISEPASGLITDVILEEDAHTQERDLLKQVPVATGELWVRRGPKKPKPRRSKGDRYHHFATKKPLDEAAGARQPRAG